jgi:XTP/dITP diphosphohydrolase
MARQFTEKQLIIASHNPGKVREIDDLLRPFGITVRSASELSLDEPEETGNTFVTNAILKAKTAANATQLPALADDSGLAVSALGGDPGIYSARWAEPGKDFAVAMEKIEALLKPESVRTAQFVCALALAWPDRHVETFEGLVKGNLVWPPRGTAGFGYDPMFLPDGRVETFGEMDQAEKHTISHRADAFRKLVAACFR